MSKRKWTSEEIQEWRREHGRGVGYFNKEDSNIFVPKALGFGWTMNWASPVAWIIIAAVIAAVIRKEAF